MAQAEGWVIKGKLVRSQKFNALNGDDFTQKIYCLLIACKDSWGMMPADPFSLKANLGPLDETKRPPAYEKAVKKLRDVGLVYLWDHQGAPWLYVLGHDEEAPTSRRALNPQVPRPDIEAMWAETNELMTKSGLSLDSVKHPPARARSQSPFPNPNPDPNPSRARSEIDLLLEEGIPEQQARDFLELRKKHKAPLTPTALKGIKREADKANLTLTAAIEICCARGWRGFKAEWLDKSEKGKPPPQSQNTEPQQKLREIIDRNGDKVIMEWQGEYGWQEVERISA